MVALVKGAVAAIECMICVWMALNVVDLVIPK